VQLSLSNLSKRYGKVTALHPFNLKAEGEIIGIIGNNGAGKSTLMKMIVGLLPPPRKAMVLLGGQNPREAPETYKRQVGYLPESPMLYPRLTPEELLNYVGEVKGVQRLSEEVEHWLVTFGLSEKRHALLSGLSFGMKKKMALSAAFLGDPPLLVLDEPFNGLDVATMERLSEILLKRHERGATILISSHLMAYIERLCQRVVILKQGRVVSEGKPEALKKALAVETFHDVFLHFTAPAASSKGSSRTID